jgi:peptidoglycan/LPS O-acetylase OafA/YrhL
MLFHLVLRYQELLADEMPSWLRPVFAALAGQGLFGVLPVYWFFMISGFVIVWTLERCRDWRDFLRFSTALYRCCLPRHAAEIALTTIVADR